MKREILFKAVRVDNGEWVFGQLVFDASGKPRIVQIDSSGKGLVFIEVHPDTVCQFTGLLDKNGEKIFEGDQLYICSGYSSIVEFCEGNFVSVYSHPEDGEIIPLNEVIGKNTEIIGNIHDKKQTA